MFRKSLGLVALLLFTLCVPFLFGQGETTGTITGTVLDPSGAAISNAKVTLTDVGTGLARTQQTGSGGEFTFVALEIGTYSLTVEATGFRKSVRDQIDLHVNNHLRIDPKMEVGSMAETVTVASEIIPVNTESPELSGLINCTQIREMPLPNRNFMGLTLLVPGVTYTGGREISFGGLSGNPMFINGSRNTANNWMVDGSRNTDTGSNGTLFNYAPRQSSMKKDR